MNCYTICWLTVKQWKCINLKIKWIKNITKKIVKYKLINKFINIWIFEFLYCKC